MKGKDNNGRRGPDDFLRYRKGEMNDREKNAFERELQKDPFAEEAEEGFSGLDTAETKEDLLRLNKRLRARTSSGTGFKYYRIAASIAVLMIISSVFFIINKKSTTTEPYEIGGIPATMEITESKPILKTKTEPAVKKTGASVKATTDKAEYEKEKMQEDETVSKKAVIAPEKKPEAVQEEVAVADEMPVSQVAAGEPPVSKAREAVSRAEPSEPELADVAVISYGVTANEAKAAKAIDYKGDMNTGYSAPEPEGGKRNFDSYVQENLKIPEFTGKTDRAVVLLNLYVSASGSVDSVNIIRSPGPEYSSEAERLIREGPKWIPAKRNGENIDDSVRVRLTFKR